MVSFFSFFYLSLFSLPTFLKNLCQRRHSVGFVPMLPWKKDEQPELLKNTSTVIHPTPSMVARKWKPAMILSGIAILPLQTTIKTTLLYYIYNYHNTIFPPTTSANNTTANTVTVAPTSSVDANPSVVQQHVRIFGRAATEGLAETIATSVVYGATILGVAMVIGLLIGALIIVIGALIIAKKL